MAFLTILIATVIELLIVSFEGFRSDRWVRDWLRLLQGAFGRSGWWDGPFGVGTTLAVPAVIVAVLFNWLSEGSVIILVAAGVLVLLLTFGLRDLSREIEVYLAAYTGDDGPSTGDAEVTFLEAVDLQPSDPERAVLEAIPVAAHTRWFAPLFWFALLGPIGPVIYRMTAVLREQERQFESFSALIERLYQVLIWVPTRLFLLGLGLAGTLTPTLEVWRKQDDFCLYSSERVLRETGLAAVNYGKLDEMIGEDPHVYWVNAMSALVKRTFALWLVLLAITTLVGF